MTTTCHHEVADPDGQLEPCGRRARHTRIDHDTVTPYPVCAHHRDPEETPATAHALLTAALNAATQRAAAEQYPDHATDPAHETGLEGFILGAEWERARQQRP